MDHSPTAKDLDVTFVDLDQVLVYRRGLWNRRTGCYLGALGVAICGDCALDGPALGGTGFQDGPYQYCNPLM